MKNTKTIHICHWHSNFRKSVRYSLETPDDILEIIGESESLDDCKKWLSNNQVDYLLVGYSWDENKKIERLKALIDSLPDTKVIVFTLFERELLGKMYIDAGAYACYDSDSSVDNLRSIILGDKQGYNPESL